MDQGRRLGSVEKKGKWNWPLLRMDHFKLRKVGTNAVTLQFPPKSRAHPIVNISRVQLYFGSRPKLITAPPDDDAGHEYEVDRIMGYRKRNRKEYYYIHWKGYPVDDDTWKPKENISEAALKVWEHQCREKWRMDELQEPRLWLATDRQTGHARADVWVIPRVTGRPMHNGRTEEATRWTTGPHCGTGRVWIMRQSADPQVSIVE